MRPPGERPAGRLFTFASAGWVLVLAALLGVAVTVQVLRLRTIHRERVFGKRGDVASYRFALEPSRIPVDRLETPMPRNAVDARLDPPDFTIDQIENSPDRKLRKLLTPDDRVVGVVLGGQARAYPLRVLNWHEVINDTLGGVPIAVSYHPLTDAVVVFDRRVAGETAEFRVSGLLFNSSQLLFRRRDPPGGESLWSPLRLAAVTGPDAAAGLTLTPLPCSVVSWGDWRERHPDTTVTAPDPLFRKHYPRMPYGTYFGSRLLRYPVDPYPPPGPHDPWSRVLVVHGGDGPEVIHDYEGDDSAVPEGRPVLHALWWAWWAIR